MYHQDNKTEHHKVTYRGGGANFVGGFVEEVAPFSYLNNSFILSLNVKVYIRFIVFIQISLCFLFVKNYVG